eukprot:403362400
MGGCDDLQSKTVKKVEKPLHLILFIINIFFPGLGTCISACVNKGGSFSLETLVVGLLQMFLCWLFIGWIWSIWWGYLIYKKSD